MLRAAGGLCCAAGFGALLLLTLAMDGSGRYPLSYSQILIAGIAVLFVISAVRDWREIQAAEVAHPDAAISNAPGGVNAMLATVALCVLYAAAWPVLGFLLATFVYVAAQIWLLRQRGWLYLLGVPVAVTLVVWLVFAKLLLLPFPQGLLFGD
jgi:hypothetical protein